DGQYVSPYLLKMKGCMETLERLGYPMPKELCVSLILNSPNKDYDRGGKIQEDKKKSQGEKGKDKGKTKLAYVPKPKISPPPKRDNLATDSICHQCKEGLTRRRKLKHGALNMYVGNGMRLAVEAIVSFDLIFPNELVIILDNFHYALSITRGVVSLSRLIDNGYMHTFVDYGIYVMNDDVFYFNAIPHDGIDEIDMHNLYPN
nr:hypothetical protein [Tanacetum cinerariifolium]